MTLGQSVVYIKTTTVACVMAFEWPPMLLAVNSKLVDPAHLLGLGNARIDQLHLAFPFDPFHFCRMLGLVCHFCITLNIIKY